MVSRIGENGWKPKDHLGNFIAIKKGNYGTVMAVGVEEKQIWQGMWGIELEILMELAKHKWCLKKKIKD